MTRQLLWIILCSLPEKGRKETEEIVEMKEGQGRKRNMTESEEIEGTRASARGSQYPRPAPFLN